MTSKSISRLFILLLILGATAHAAEIMIPNDPTSENFILRLDIQATPYKELKDPTPQATQDGLKLQSTESNFLFYLPNIDVFENASLHQKFEFGGLFLNYENFNDINPKEVAHLYATSYQGELIVPVNTDWMIRGRVLPGFYTDAEGSSSNNFKMQGGVNIDRIHDHGTVGLGALYTNALGRPLLLPTLSLIYKTNAYLVEGELPLSLAGWIRSPQGTSWGLVSRIHGNQYGVNKVDSIYEGHDFEYSIWTLGPAIRAETEKAFMQLDLGYTLRRKMRVTDGETSVLDFTPDNTWYITGTVQFQP